MLKYLLFLVFIVITACVKTSTPNTNNEPLDNQIMCTQDAMQCPDGHWVGRTGPKCEFSCSKETTAK